MFVFLVLRLIPFVVRCCWQGPRAKPRCGWKRPLLLSLPRETKKHDASRHLRPMLRCAICLSGVPLLSVVLFFKVFHSCDQRAFKQYTLPSLKAGQASYAVILICIINIPLQSFLASLSEIKSHFILQTVPTHLPPHVGSFNVFSTFGLKFKYRSMSIPRPTVCKIPHLKGYISAQSCLYMKRDPVSPLSTPTFPSQPLEDRGELGKGMPKQ